MKSPNPRFCVRAAILLLATSLPTLHAQQNLITDSEFVFSPHVKGASGSGSATPGNGTEPAEGDFITLEGQMGVTGAQKIPVDPTQAYAISGWFRSSGEPPSRLFFGVACFDENQELIQPFQINHTPESETVLVEACHVADTEITVKDASKWMGGEAGLVAFEIEPGLKDLPNRKTSSIGITSREAGGKGWKVTLKSPVGQSFPAGTAVREHQAGAAAVYCGASNVEVPAFWKQYQGTISGVEPGFSNQHFWPGTRSISIFLIGNQGQENTGILDAGGFLFSPL